MRPARNDDARGQPGAAQSEQQDDPKRSATSQPAQRWCVVVDGSRGPRLWGRHRDRTEADRVAGLLRKHGFAVRVEAER